MSDGIKTPCLDEVEYRTGASSPMEVEFAALSFPKIFTFEGMLSKLNTLNATKNACHSFYTYACLWTTFITLSEKV